jgi:pilus assembly protein CpaB
MRAISVPVKVTSGISGFVFPGDQVDLLLTYAVPSATTGGAEGGTANFQHKAAETVLRDIRVIAIDRRLDSKAGEAVLAHTATFEVSAKNSEVIALASEIGKVSLTLRSLVPTPHETAAAENLPGEAANQNSPDSSVAAAATITLDSEISPLLPKAGGGKDVPLLCILRGGAKGCESI